MNMYANGFSRVLKIQFSAIIVMLSIGCTSTYKIEYSVNSPDPRGISSEDVQAIRQSLLNDPQIVAVNFSNKKTTDLVNQFYLSRHIDAHEILTISENDSGLLLSVTRLTKYLGDFSETWMWFFEKKTKNTIERAINKTVRFSLLPR